jgi:hypothetical protein
MTPAAATATAVTFTWLGMVLAISFLETPLKFRAPDVTLRIGLGIGRLVFRALNAVEAALALALLATFLFGSPPAGAVIPAIVTAAVLVVQIVVVRPRLSRRSGRILAGEDAPRSRSHYAYVILETLKVAGLITTGALLVAS